MYEGEGKGLDVPKLRDVEDTVRRKMKGGRKDKNENVSSAIVSKKSNTLEGRVLGANEKP